MKAHDLLLTNLNDDMGYPDILSKGTKEFGLSLLSRFNMLLYSSRHAAESNRPVPQETHNSFNKYAGNFFLWLSATPSSMIFDGLSRHSSDSRFKGHQMHIKHLSSSMQNLAGLAFSYRMKDEHTIQVLFSRLMYSMFARTWSEINHHHLYDRIALEETSTPPPDTMSPKSPSETVSVGDTGVEVSNFSDQSSGIIGHQSCNYPVSRSPVLAGDAIEPKTGTRFPAILGDHSNLCSEVLVGMGFRSMRIIRSINLYAFGLYIQPSSICQKLGHKYATVPRSELKDHPDFYKDLLRENICMSARVVVNCKGLSVDTVRDAFEKSLRTRLQKMKPNTDFHCLKAFSSCFNKDVPIPIGTTIDFRQTADGVLITEIDGRRVGAVHSKELCSAFFDMYIGDPPVSQQAKREIADNVANIIRRC